MAFCPNCGTPNTDQAEKCVACGFEITAPKQKAKFKGTIMMSGIKTPAPPAAAPPAPPPPSPVSALPPPPPSASPPAPSASVPGRNMSYQKTMLGPASSLAPPPAPQPASGPPQATLPPSQLPGAASGVPPYAPPPAMGSFTPPPPSGSFTQPPPAGSFAPPPPAGSFAPPPAGSFAPPPPAGSFAPPPAGSFGPPPQGGSFAPPPPAGSFTRPPPSGSFAPSAHEPPRAATIYGHGPGPQLPPPGATHTPIPAVPTPAPAPLPPELTTTRETPVMQSAAGALPQFTPIPPPPSGSFGASEPRPSFASASGYGAQPGATGGASPSAYPRPAAPPVKPNPGKIVAIGCGAVLALACLVAATLYFLLGPKLRELFASSGGAGNDAAQWQAQMAQSLVNVAEICQDNCDEADMFFHPQRRQALVGQAKALTQERVNALADPTRSEATMLNDTDDAELATELGLDAQQCVRVTAKEAKAISCSVPEPGKAPLLRIIHLSGIDSL